MDLHEISALLHIEEKTRDHPTLKDIHDAVLLELKKANDDHVAAKAKPEDKPAEVVPATEGEPEVNEVSGDEPETVNRRI